LLAARIPVTFFLLLYSVAVSIFVAVPLAIASALRRNRATDHAIRLFSMVTFAMPSFLLGLLLILVFSLNLHFLPTSGYGEGFVGHLRGLTLPAITVGLYLAPILLRTLRVGIIETLGVEFVEAARARGLSAPRIVLKHVLRNSMVSTLTLLGLNIGFLLSGLVIVENVFALPGLGSELVSSIVGRDYPTIQALTLVFGVAVVAINLLTDVLYAVLDPRVRL
jgi:peptide/nickel transport system permease protein